MEDPPFKLARSHDIELESHSSTELASDQDQGLSPSDYESHSSSGHSNTRSASPSSLRHGQPVRDISSKENNHDHHHNPYHRHHDIHAHSSEVRQRAWYEFDIAVLLAIVSPAVNWLTGGDHVKNMLFIALLVFYLHQIIEAPWRLYQNAQCRAHPPYHSPSTHEDKYRELATSELRKFELFYLALTIISPFIGAHLLRYTTESILGPESISWFSTGLFVMATGVRPWSHLIERLGQRATELQDFIHYPPPFDPKHHRSQEEMQDLIGRVDKLEKSVCAMKDRLKITSEDVFDYVDDALDSMKHNLQKRQKRWDEQEEKLRSFEESFALLSASASDAGQKSGSIIGITVEDAKSILDHILSKWILTPPPQPEKGRGRYNSRRSSRFFSKGTVTPGRLETILEEDREGAHFLPAKLLSFGARLVYGVGYVVFMPLQLALSIFHSWNR